MFNFTWGRCSCCLDYVKRREYILPAESNGLYFGQHAYEHFVIYCDTNLLWCWLAGKT